ncbi:MAG: hypothetical protein A2X18_10865 [Bacteroidetes bacterium GWF2_40_14]|nr:MAG: hypothetical protein A2X18_10865 [Bacteroidetes bacterium GWF2_40_14]
MKNLVLLSILLICTYSYGQKFSVSPNGLRDANNTEKSFIIIPVEGKTAKELYDQAIKYININYKSPDNVIKGKIEGEYLRFNTYAPHFIIIKNVLARAPFNAKFSTELSFKDGKIKYEIIDLEIYSEANYPLYFTGSGISSFFIYNKEGILKREDAKTGVEDFFNALILSFSLFLQTDKVQEEW